MDVCVRLCYTCVLDQQEARSTMKYTTGYCKSAKKCRCNQMMQYFPGQFELPQQKHLLYAVMCVLLLASAIVHVEPATAADRVIHAVIVVHTCAIQVGTKEASPTAYESSSCESEESTTESECT